jgi:hypothetical protein
MTDTACTSHLIHFMKKLHNHIVTETVEGTLNGEYIGLFQAKKDTSAAWTFEELSQNKIYFVVVHAQSTSFVAPQLYELLKKSILVKKVTDEKRNSTHSVPVNKK